jgi:hypothetical protein
LERKLDKNFSTSDIAMELVDETAIELRKVFKDLIMGIAKARNQGTRSALINQLKSMPLLESMPSMWSCWKRLKKDLDAGFLHTLDEQPFYEVYRTNGVDIRDNNVAEAECKRVQTLRKSGNGFKKLESTQNRLNGFFLDDRTNDKISRVKREISEFQPTYCFNIPLQLCALNLADLGLFTKIYQIPGQVLKDAAERFQRIGVKQFSFIPCALPSFARELQNVVEGLFADLNIPYEAENSADPLSLTHKRKQNFPALSNEIVTEDKTLLIFKEALEKTQEITQRYCGNYVIQRYMVAVDVLETVSGIRLKPYYKMLLSQGLISNHCPRKWNYSRKRVILQKQLEEGQNAQSVEFRENGWVAYITNPNTVAAKMLMSNAGLDKPAVPERFIFEDALRRNRRFTGHNRVKIGDGIYDTDLLALLIKSLKTADFSLHQSGKDMPLGIKIGECMVVVSPMVIIGTNAEKTYLETPSLTDLNMNNFCKTDCKKPKFSLSQWGRLGKRIEPPKDCCEAQEKIAEPIKERRQITAVQLKLFGIPGDSKRFSLAEWGRRKSVHSGSSS